jgi:hypothetical protein
MRGTPYIVRPQAGLLRPKSGGLGADLAGRVAAVGRDVTGLAPGGLIPATVTGLSRYLRLVPA